MARDDLEAMGFEAQDIDRAMANTDGSVEACVDWIAAHQGESAEQSAPATDSNPPQSTEERLAQLKARAAERTAREEKQRRRDHLEIGKRQAEAERARQDMQIAQAKKDAEARRRQAIEDRKYKDELRKRIEQDRKEREAQREAEKAARVGAAEGAASAATGTGTATPSKAAPAASSAPTPAAASAPSTVRLRVRYGPKTLTKSLAPELTVEDLGEELAPELGLAPGTFEFEVSYPRKRVAVVGNTETVLAAGLSNASVNVHLV